MIPQPPRRADGRDRPWREAHEGLNGILWMLRSGAHWQELPARSPPYQTGHRRFKRWVHDGTLRSSLETLAEDLRAPGALDLGDCFIDGTLVVAKRGPGVGKAKRGKGTKLMAVADRTGPALAVHTASATPPEVTSVPDTLPASLTPERPERLIGDNAYESAPLDGALAAVGIERSAPRRAHRTRPTTQDGRPLRRYTRRGKVARPFARRQHSRRVLVRHAYQAENSLGFVHLGCILILLRCYL